MVCLIIPFIFLFWTFLILLNFGRFGRVLVRLREFCSVWESFGASGRVLERSGEFGSVRESFGAFGRVLEHL